MVDLLMRYPAVVLEDVVVLDALCDRNLLGYAEDFGEVVIGDVVQLCAVEFGDDELATDQRNSRKNDNREASNCTQAILTEWPLERGPMSRKASVFSDSKSFMQGISPGSG